MAVSCATDHLSAADLVEKDLAVVPILLCRTIACHLFPRLRKVAT